MGSLEARWRAGNLTAFARAIYECWLRLRTDKWLVQTPPMLSAALCRKTSGAPARLGRASNAMGGVAELRERRYELFDRFKDDRGTSWERAREAVSEILEKSGAAGSASAIKASYEPVEAAGGAHATFESYKELLRERSQKGRRPRLG